ncbi:MAG: PaeR7I family type II restriction endonuclease [Solirubrobacterales bacterium]
MDQKRFEAAVRSYWEVRTAQSGKQAAAGKSDAGSRGAVTGGKHLDAMADLIEEIFLDAGFPESSINRSSRVELPGYFRAEKKWDLVVVHEGTLAAAIEFKSQVGPSFGNNFNNRCEEAIGNAVDVWTAFREGTFGTSRPWLGYMFLLEEAEGSTKAVKVAEPFFDVDPEFEDASYKKRYEILCRRLLLERLYDAACLVTSSADPQAPIHEPSAELSFTAFIGAIRGRAAALSLGAS